MTANRIRAGVVLAMASLPVAFPCAVAAHDMVFTIGMSGKSRIGTAAARAGRH